MSTFTQLEQLRRLLYGERVSRATALTPQTTHAAIFTIAGGRVIVTSITGQLTAAADVNASSIKLASYPTVGTSGDLCAATAMANKELGALIGITGLTTDALVIANAFYAPVLYRRIVLPVGAIHLDASGNNLTASIKWELQYIPLDPGASVAAA